MFSFSFFYLFSAPIPTLDVLKIKHLFCSVKFYQNILHVLENDFANTFTIWHFYDSGLEKFAYVNTLNVLDYWP